MEFDDIDDPFQSERKPSKFAPKSSKFQPKTKAGAKVQPKPLEVVSVKKEDAKMEVEEEKEKNEFGIKEEGEKREVAESSMDEDDVVMEERKEEEVEKDYVVAEYDFYFTPSDPQTQLYVLQYPLRPSWRPYELDQRCTEVRVKPDSGAMEVDLLIETDSDNYDPGFRGADNINKQTLSSEGKLRLATTYAVGVLIDKKLYINPIHAILQLRPSIEYLDSDGSKKKPNPNNNDALALAVAGSSRKQSKQMDSKSEESWITLKYCSSANELTKRYLSKMVTEQKDPLQFLMKPVDYLNSVCPGAVINQMKSAKPSIWSLRSLPLEERLKTWLLEGPPVQKFCAIKHLAPEHRNEDILEVLQKYAHLVQGLWVPKTSIRYPNPKGAEPLARDYALLLFSKNPVIKDSELVALGSQKSTGKAVLREIAFERSSCKDWKLREDTDVSFMKHFPKVVEQQQKLWQDHEKRISDILAMRKSRLTSNSAARSGLSMSSKEGASRPNNVARSLITSSMSNETREALPKVLRKLFQNHKVCSLQTIRQGLRDMAVSISANAKVDTREIVMAAARGADAPQEELQAVICEVATNVHGVYVLKSSSEHPENNPLRNLVIDLFLGSGPNAKLKKGEVIEAAKIRLKKEPTNGEFSKVMSEFCASKGGGWMLKSGDGGEN